ncbi:hypothetical protein AB9T88_05545, partial [Flavobacterium sp. LBUM151]
MKQNLINVIRLLQLEKERFRKISIKKTVLEFQNETSFSKLFTIFFFLLFVLFSSNVEAQVSVTPTSFCSGTSPTGGVRLSVRIIGGGPRYNITYQIGNGSPILVSNYISTNVIPNIPLPGTTTTYTLLSIVDAGTNAVIPLPAVKSATIIVLPRPAVPTITANGPTTFCEGESVVLESSVGSTYKWTTPQGATFNTQSITATASGNYTVQVTNANGCSSISSVAKTIIVNTKPATPIIETIT